ncbi:MAG: hypothetical protein KatS3mg111_1013 [Pirellulaceae bacterium]|nr:MAG: hypothetical protein KatS3mg111_1013 [Pirellulaceae bacterium]
MLHQCLQRIVWMTTIPCVLSALHAGARAQQPRFVPNYDEQRVPAFELPPIMTPELEQAEDFAAAWQQRRAELLDLFATQVYGVAPQDGFEVHIERFESGEALGGRAWRQQFRVAIKTSHGQRDIDLLVYTPQAAVGSIPCFLGLNFYGNHTIADDPAIAITKSWCRSSEEFGVVDHRATAAGRGKRASRWPVGKIIDAGFGLATAYYGDIDPDFDDGFTNGVHGLFPQHRPSAEQPSRWGSIAAWAWGLSRILDGIAQGVPQIDPQRVVVIGHSRLGKTALWAGASDERFAGVISNDSGCGGAALSRRAFGETVARINSAFPHWFCPNFKQYDERESALPIDQHQLLACIAPRPLHVASASEDLWADPRGEFLATKLASIVWESFGYPPFPLDAFPPPDTAVLGRVSYHLRAGRHDLTVWDWQQYLQTMQQQVAGEKLRIGWQQNFLHIEGERIPGGRIDIHYLEAYCRDGSSHADWVQHTVVGHRTQLVEASADGTFLKLHCQVRDGLQVTHEIRSGWDCVTFDILAENPTDRRSEVHWAQPCMRVDRFTGRNQNTYLEKSFIFVNGRLQRLPCEPWATTARYTPGQVWRPQHVPPTDVNPRPLSPIHPSHGLIGCFSHDESMVLAIAFEPWQELFQGVIVCLHNDFRLGGIPAGEKRRVRGCLYLQPADIPRLLRRYAADFPERVEASRWGGGSPKEPPQGRLASAH